MNTPYVQDVNKWVDHYKSKHSYNAMLKRNSDNFDNFATSTTKGVAQESNMFVSKVEPRGPMPQVPSTATPAALRTVSTSQGALQQALYDAKREQIEMKQTNSLTGGRKAYNLGVKRSTSTSTKGKPKAKKDTKVKKVQGKGSRNKKRELFGTPGDIFKKKTTPSAYD